MAEKYELTEKQRVFVAEFMKDKNSTQAAIRAGYSPKSAEVTGSRLLSNAKVRSAIDEQLEKQEKRLLLSADRILLELYRIGTADIRSAFNDDGTLKPIKEIPEDVARAISGIEVDELFDGYGEERTITGVTKKIRFWEKNKALELLGKHLKLFVDRLEVSGVNELADRLKRSRERVNGSKGR